MTSPFQKSVDPNSRILIELAELRRMAEDAAKRPHHIPVLSADPPDSDPTNMWLLPDGRLRARHRNTADTAWVIREWVSTTAGSSSSGTAPAPPSSAPITRQDTWSAIWSQSYRQGGTARTDAGVYRLYYGSSGDGFNGRNQSLIGFDHAAIATALSGSTVNAVWLDLTNLHAWYHSGVTIYFGVHNFSSEPATWAGGGIPASKITNHKFGKPQQRTVPMPLQFATMIRDNTGKGVAIEAPSSSIEFYGYAAGVGSGYSLPKLIVNYTK